MGSEQTEPRDAGHWAAPVSKLHVTDVPTGAVNLNVEGRQVVGPLQGFGQLWQKTYRVRLSGVEVSPSEVVAIWKERLPEFMPDHGRFYTSVAGIEPGEVLLINATVPVPALPGGLPIETGMLVLYSDEESFTLMCPEGHLFSGWNTFSAYEEEGVTVAQVQSLERATDPIYEIGSRFMGGAAQQEQIWHHVLKQLAAEYDVVGQIQSHKTMVDSRIQWSQAKNIWHSALIRSVLYTPARIMRRMRGGRSAD